MALTVAEAARQIISEWRGFQKEHGGSSTHDMLTFYMWLQKNRPDLLCFKCKGDRWQRVKGWLQNSDSR